MGMGALTCGNVWVVPELVVLVHPSLGEEALVLALESGVGGLLPRTAPGDLMDTRVRSLPRLLHQRIPIDLLGRGEGRGRGPVRVEGAQLGNGAEVLWDVPVDFVSNGPGGVLLLVACDPNGNDVVRVDLVEGDLDGVREGLAPLPGHPEGGEVRDEDAGVPRLEKLGHHVGGLAPGQVERDVERGQALLHLLEALDHEEGVALPEGEVGGRHDEDDDDRLLGSLRLVHRVKERPVVTHSLIPLAQVHHRAGFVRCASAELAPPALVDSRALLSFGRRHLPNSFLSSACTRCHDPMD